MKQNINQAQSINLIDEQSRIFLIQLLSKKYEKQIRRSFIQLIKMLSNPPSNLQILVTKLLIDNKYQKAIQKGLENYQIKQFKIQNLLPTQVFLMHYNITSKFYSNRPIGNTDSWCQNQLRLFVWLLVGYCFLEQRQLTEMTLQDWQFFSQIFNNRHPDFLQFHGLSIIKREQKFAKWTQDQYKLLDKIIKSKSVKNKWNQIAKDLFVQSNKKYFRTGKQCRQHWINHLDPTPKRTDWQIHEDYNLVKAIKNIGKKWAKVSQKLQGKRTQHMVKNRFKSLYQLQVRRCKQEYHRTFSQSQIILQMERRLKSIVQQNQKAKITTPKHQNQCQKSVKINNFQSAGERNIQIQSIQTNKIQQPLLQFEEEKQGSTLKLNQMIQTFSQIQGQVQDLESSFFLRSPTKKERGVNEDFNNFFQSEFFMYSD